MLDLGTPRPGTERSRALRSRSPKRVRKGVRRLRPRGAQKYPKSAPRSPNNKRGAPTSPSPPRSAPNRTTRCASDPEPRDPRPEPRNPRHPSRNPGKDFAKDVAAIFANVGEQIEHSPEFRSWVQMLLSWKIGQKQGKSEKWPWAGKAYRNLARKSLPGHPGHRSGRIFPVGYPVWVP